MIILSLGPDISKKLSLDEGLEKLNYISEETWNYLTMQAYI